ncbi:MAG TPA: alpha/beta fold hydrolase [Steroidobacteraceae bacterium]
MPKAPTSRPAATSQPRVRRGYFDCRYGQLHVHNSIPSGGGFEEGIPLLCLHPVPHSGRVFMRFLAVAGVGRSVFAPDLPGFGESDPPPGQAGVTEHAAAMGDFLDTMRLRQVDLLGHCYGALVAAELAATRATQVRRLALVSPPVAAEIVGPESIAPATDGSHLLEEWRRAVAYCGRAASPRATTSALADRLRNGAAAAAAAAAAERTYPLRARLAPLATPLLVLRVGDEANRGQAHDVPARARVVDLPQQGASLFETAPEAAAQALESFLR